MPMQTVKMVITGPFSAGKTEFIRSISEIDVVTTDESISSSSAEYETKEATTVAMDSGRITVDDDLVLYVFGTPGQKRFDLMWEILSEGMLGFVVMVDSTRPETFREARSILETFRAYAPTPYVVAANKQDFEDSWEIDDMRIAPSRPQGCFIKVDDNGGGFIDGKFGFLTVSIEISQRSPTIG